MVIVANVKSWSGKGHYIGRSMPDRKGSALCNLNKIGLSLDRGRVIELYARWFWDMVHDHKKEQAAWQELQNLKAQHDSGKDVVLLCWCAPLACHGDVIKAYLEKEQWQCFA